MPVTPIALTSSGATPFWDSSRRLISQALAHHPRGSCSAQPGRGDLKVAGRDATPTTWSGNRIRMPTVDVVPISRPRIHAILRPPNSCRSAQGLDLVHEALHTIGVDRIPGIAVDLK